MILATEGPTEDVEVQRPTNTIAIAGHKLILPCSSQVNNESRWDFYDLDTATPTNIYNGNSDVNTKGRRRTLDYVGCRLKTCNLTIESVQFIDAGYYVCFESSTTGRKAASLVVLGKL